MEYQELFVPGRVGIIGELSDHNAQYLLMNERMIPGEVLAMPIDKGIYSRARRSDQFIYKYLDHYAEIEFTDINLESYIHNNDFLSYICGTLLLLKKNYDVSGIEIHIDKMTLPIKAGLSSSACICTTIVKAYNLLYHLNLSDNEIFELAYYGERLAGSKCGMLDQLTILTDGLVHFQFYNDKIHCHQIKVKKDIPLLAVYLNGDKNTKEIMECFDQELSKKDGNDLIYNIVGIQNRKLVKNCIKGIEEGNLELIGQQFSLAQEAFDKAAVICQPFESPILHLILNDEKVKQLSLGGKSMGSGGDGTLLLILESQESLEYLSNYIQEKYQKTTFDVSLKKQAVKSDHSKVYTIHNHTWN